MSSHEVDGVTLPDQVAGHPVLEFCNTRAGWNAPTHREYLVDPHALAVWAGHTGLLPTDQVDRLRGLAPDPGAQRTLREALDLREALYPVLLGRGRDADWETVSRLAARARGRSRLTRTEVGARWDPPRTGTDTALLAVAGAAADLLTAHPPVPVAACPGEGCGWLFSDPRRRRRWCSMAVCGNRSKARNYRGRGRTG